MKTIGKIPIAAGLVVASIALGIGEMRRAAHWERNLAVLAQQREPVLEQLRQLRRELNETANHLTVAREDNDRLGPEVADLPKLRGEVTRLRDDSSALARLRTGESGVNGAKANDSVPAAIEDWRLPIVDQLRQAIDQMPERKIPELRFLTDKDWLDAALLVGSVGLDTDDNVRYGLSHLRSAAKYHFVHMLREALDSYSKASGGQLPATLSQLQAYFPSPVDDAILQRYQILQTGKVEDLPGRPWVVEKAPVDEDHDLLFQIWPKGRINNQEVNAAERERQALMKLAR